MTGQTMSIYISNCSLLPMDFNTLCFYIQVVYPARRDFGELVLEDIPVEDSRYYEEMGRDATTLEYYRHQIHLIAARALSFTGTTNVDEKYGLTAVYHDKEEIA